MSDLPHAEQLSHERPRAVALPRFLGRWSARTVVPSAVLAALTIVVVAVQFSYLRTVSTSVPHQDEWKLLDAMFQSFDSNNVTGWLFYSHNGHFGVAGKLGYLVSYHFFALDLAPLRFLNFPICVVGLLLVARIVVRHVRRPLTRWYLISGAALVLFNLCVWEHFSQGSAFATILGAIVGSVGLYYAVRALYAVESPLKYTGIGFGCIVVAILSFGIGYAALAAALAVVSLWLARRFTSVQAMPWVSRIAWAGALVIFLLALLSHPLLHVRFPLSAHLYHLLLVAGSIWGGAFENPQLAQKVAYVCGLFVFFLSLCATADFLTRRRHQRESFSAFAIAVVLFGIAACAAVAAARPGLPDQEFLSSRYTLQTSVGLVGLLLYFAHAQRLVLGQVWCLVAVGYLFATIEERQIGPYRPAVYNSIEATVRKIETVDDAELGRALYWGEDVKAIRRVAARIQRDRLNMFRNDR